MIWLKEILNKNLPGSYIAFVFGSQANKKNLTRSDIDIGLMSDDPITSIQLTNITADIDALPMLYRIDVVNFNEVDEQFKLIALNNVEYL